MKLEDRYEIDIAWSDEDDAFVARIPDMPYTGAHGDSHEEALAMAKSAISLYIKTARALDKPVPHPSRVFA